MAEDNTPSQPLLSPDQRKLAGAAVACASAAFLALVMVAALMGMVWFIATFHVVILPLVVAGIMSLMLRPLVHVIERRLKLSRTKAIIAIYVLVASVCLALAYVALPIIVKQLIGIIKVLPDTAKNLEAHLLDKVTNADLKESIQKHLDPSQLDQFATQAVSDLGKFLQTAENSFLTAIGLLKKIFGEATALAVIPIYLFYLLQTDRDLVSDLRQQLTFLKGPVRHDIVFLVTEFVNILVSFFRGQLLIGLILGILKAIGFTIINVKFGAVLGLFFGLMNIVPYLGTIMGLATVLPIAYFQTGGGWQLVFEAASVFAIVQLCEGYYITPKIMGKHTGLHPMAIMLSIFFWGEAFGGILGMVLAVPLTAFLVVVWRLLRHKYLPKHGTGLTRPPMRSPFDRQPPISPPPHT